MRPERWPQVERHLLAVLGLGPEERDRHLRRIRDPGIRREVEHLLAGETACAGFLEIPAAEALLSSFDDGLRPELPPPGERIGAYRVERELGCGGMGRVVLARRDDDAFERRVAIKLIHAQLGGCGVEKRF
ncbi:MAG: hypothetical protein MI919_13500, partial [Holophagales bacterium]|nr:hypothetical protein [Holophagales bacterium]